MLFKFSLWKSLVANDLSVNNAQWFFNNLVFNLPTVFDTVNYPQLPETTSLHAVNNIILFAPLSPRILLLSLIHWFVYCTPLIWGSTFFSLCLAISNVKHHLNENSPRVYICNLDHEKLSSALSIVFWYFLQCISTRLCPFLAPLRPLAWTKPLVSF